MTSPSFSNYLLRIGNEIEKPLLDDIIRLLSHMVIPYVDEKTSLNLLTDHVFPNLCTFATNPESMIHQSILTPKNDYIDTHKYITYN